MLHSLYSWIPGYASERQAAQAVSKTLATLSGSFPEESLASSGDEGFGFFPACLGMPLNDSRYQVLRKLGRGQFSSTWLASDSLAEERLRYCAIKILTVHATKGHHNGHLLELAVMQSITSSTKMPVLPRLRHHFEMEGPHGRHLCLVLPVLSGSVHSFRLSAPSKLLEPRKVKIIVVQVVEALVQLHAGNIIHTDVKPGNVLFTDGVATETIQTLLEHTPQAVDGEFELDGRHYLVMRSQPIPHPFQWNDPGIVVERYSVCLTDFSNAQQVKADPPTRTISAYALRAPEVILGAEYGTKADVWSLGCMTFELLTGRWLFHPQEGPTWRLEDDHLAKMMEFTAENFDDRILAKSRKRDEYFDKSGKLLRINELFPTTLENAMKNYGLVEAEAASAASFILACLHLNQEVRSSASELLKHPWLETAYMCC